MSGFTTTPVASRIRLTAGVNCSQLTACVTKFGRTMKTKNILCAAALAAWTTNATASPLITAKFLDAVSEIESGGRSSAIGDGGRARGEFQFWRDSWDSVTALRKARRLPTKAYHLGATTSLARDYARTYFEWLEKGLRRNGVKAPTQGQLYAAWNCGLAGFKRRQFKVSNCPSHTRKAVERIKKLCK